MYSKPLHVLYISKIDNILSVSEFSMTILFFFQSGSKLPYYPVQFENEFGDPQL